MEEIKIGKSRKRIITGADKLFYVFLVLLTCSILSVSGVGHTYAAYTTYAAAQDEARVAKFQVSMEAGEEKDLSLDGINDAPVATYSFAVKSDSEVAVQADMELSLNKKLPPGVTMTLHNDTDNKDITVPEYVTVPDSEAVIYTFTKFAEFSPAAGEKKFSLVFTGGDHGSITESANIQFNLSVTMSQID